MTARTLSPADCTYIIRTPLPPAVVAADYGLTAADISAIRNLRGRLAAGRPANTGLACRIAQATDAPLWAELVGPELVPGLTGRMVWDEHTATRTEGDG